ncbi:hypothetical protein [Methanospirillum hungatei]|uniref:hypothetical protein n=1 Tax=Methanospirillum hungatei TaxID=2203 RepID=UPI00064F48FF|nr:hypothetical protein [Methanospirillum hungatei]
MKKDLANVGYGSEKAFTCDTLKEDINSFPRLHDEMGAESPRCILIGVVFRELNITGFLILVSSSPVVSGLMVYADLMLSKGIIFLILCTAYEQSGRVLDRH